MSYESVDLDRFSDTFGTFTELSSVALDGKIIDVSDEFFAEAENLIKVEPAPSLKGQFGPNGALYSGWETRRHNPEYDWCIIKFGAAGIISGFDIDTSHFNGNEAPEVSVLALLDPSEVAPSAKDDRWEEILPRVPLGPNSRHLFQIDNPETYNYVKLNMFPDGGIARFRAYGVVQAVFPDDNEDSLDLAHVFSGGRVVAVSDQHFGVGSNLLLPGRGKDMGDGWETKRSRTSGHKDWVIIKLGEPGLLEKVEIDTAHFKGNFPESVELHAIDSDITIPSIESTNWSPILPRQKLSADAKHLFDLINVGQTVFTHVLVTIFPDGGIKRVRVLGKRARRENTSIPSASAHHPVPASPSQINAIPAVPLSADEFSPYGHVVQAYSNPDLTPKNIKITKANQGSALKFHKLAPIVSCYPAATAGQTPASPGLSVYRCQPLDHNPMSSPEGWAVRLLERHPFTNQAFIPMGIGSGKDTDLDRAGRAYLVVVAKNGEDDRPDLGTLKAFIAGAGQGVVYATGIWHHPMVALDTVIDFTCVETQIGDGSNADCEIVELDGKNGFPRVLLPIN